MIWSQAGHSQDEDTPRFHSFSPVSAFCARYSGRDYIASLRKLNPDAYASPVEYLFDNVGREEQALLSQGLAPKQFSKIGFYNSKRGDAVSGKLLNSYDENTTRYDPPLGRLNPTEDPTSINPFLPPGTVNVVYNFAYLVDAEGRQVVIDFNLINPIKAAASAIDRYTLIGQGKKLADELTGFFTGTAPNQRYLDTSGARIEANWNDMENRELCLAMESEVNNGTLKKIRIPSFKSNWEWVKTGNLWTKRAVNVLPISQLQGSGSLIRSLDQTVASRFRAAATRAKK